MMQIFEEFSQQPINKNERIIKIKRSKWAMASIDVECDVTADRHILKHIGIGYVTKRRRRRTYQISKRFYHYDAADVYYEENNEYKDGVRALDGLELFVRVGRL